MLTPIDDVDFLGKFYLRLRRQCRLARHGDPTVHIRVASSYLIKGQLRKDVTNA